MEPLPLDEVRRVVVVWIGRLGDFLITTPILASLRRRFPGARITMVVGERGQEAAELCPDVDEVRVLHKLRAPFKNLRLAASLARKRYDLLLDLNSEYSRTAAAVAWLTHARAKLTFSKRGARRVFTHWIPAAREREHMLDRYARLAEALGAPYDAALRVRLRPADLERGGAALRRILPAEPRGRLIGIHPGNFKKFDNRWPEEKFVQLTDRLVAEGLEPFYLAGPGEEAPVRALVARLKRPLPMLPPLPLGATAAALSFLDLLLVNATGTAHLAAAVGTPTFCFLSRYTQTVWMPRSGPHRSVVSGSWDSCRDISVDVAHAALTDALQALPEPRRRL